MGQIPVLSAARAPRALLVAFALFLAPAAASAQVVINEIFANPVGATEGPLERVEIYNAGPLPVDMTGWAIDDLVTIGTTATRARIPEDFDTTTCPGGVIINPGEYRTLKSQDGTAYLNNGGDTVYLISNRTTNVIVNQVTYGASVEGQGYSCIPNGSSTFAWRTLTLCASNGGVGDVTPPATVADLAALPGSFPGEIRLTWTAPGDDGATGTASAYLIKVSHAAINSGNFDAAADLDRYRLEPLPAAGGTAETLFVFGLNPDSTWYFALKAQDEVPNTATVSNSPGTAPAAGSLLNADLGHSIYFGNLHSHTSYSDGVQTPAQAYTFARVSAPTPLDFLAVTDHNHVSAGMQLSNYALGMAQAASANDDGNFVAIWGQEWGIIATGGHANVFEAPVLFGWDPGQYDVFVAEGNYTGLYSAVLANPPANGYPPLISWCHPSTGDFNSYAVTADGLASVHLMALVSGPAFSTSVTESDVGSSTGNEALFQDALRKGYRVSPVADQDNHEATWGASSQSRTAVLASGLTKSEILTGLAAGRAYATQDHNTLVRLSADGHPMGSAFTSAQGVRVAISISDADVGETVTQVELYRGITGTSNAVLVAKALGNAAFQWRELQSFATGTQVHYYARIQMSNNANIWSGPVYVTYDPNYTVAVGPPMTPPEVALAVGPVPAVGRVNASFTLPSDERNASLSVFDASGRQVAQLLDGPLGAGPHRLTWTGLADDGRPVPSGVYFMRLATSLGASARRVLMVR